MGKAAKQCYLPIGVARTALSTELAPAPRLAGSFEARLPRAHPALHAAPPAHGHPAAAAGHCSERTAAVGRSGRPRGVRGGRQSGTGPRRGAAPRHGSAARGSQWAPEPGTARLHSFIHKKRGAAHIGNAPFRARYGAMRAPPRLPAPPGTHGNQPRRCYPSSRCLRRTPTRRGCTARSGTGTGPYRTPSRLLRDTGPRLGQRGALRRRGSPGVGVGPAAGAVGAGSRQRRAGAGDRPGQGGMRPAGARRCTELLCVRLEGPLSCSVHRVGGGG